MKNQFKKLLILLTIIVLAFFNLSNNIYAQSTCDRPCQADSDCFNNGFCQDLGNCQTRCVCGSIVRRSTDLSVAQEDITYGKHCENIFMCGDCWFVLSTYINKSFYEQNKFKEQDK